MGAQFFSEHLWLLAMVPLAAIALPAVIVFVVLHFRQQRTLQMVEAIKYLSDRGQPIPPELLDPPQQQEKEGSPLFQAITLLGVGVGLAIMFYMLGLRFLSGIGALVFCIGAAQLLALWIEGRQGSKSGNAAD